MRRKEITGQLSLFTPDKQDVSHTQDTLISDTVRQLIHSPVLWWFLLFWLLYSRRKRGKGKGSELHKYHGCDRKWGAYYPDRKCGEHRSPEDITLGGVRVGEISVVPGTGKRTEQGGNLRGV